MRIAVIGASGRIGSAVVAEARGRGHDVTAVVRRPEAVDDVGAPAAVADVLDPVSVADVAAGKDAVVSAVGGGDGAGHAHLMRPATISLVSALRSLEPAVPRLVTVGGAGSLRTPGGGRVWDEPGLPDFVLQIMHAHGDALDYLRTVTDVDWACLSPAQSIGPGERRGTYRTAGDDAVVDADGASRISIDDYALALVDELERHAHVRERFTVGY